MRQQSCVDISLEQLVKMLEGGKFAIPYFQRAYEWGYEQLEHLADSIFRGRPINSITLIPRQGKLKIGTHPVEVKGASLVDEFDYHVLDGQQRLTSIAKIFGDFPEETPYYFDLLSVLEDEFPDDDIVLKDPKASLYEQYETRSCVCNRIQEAKERPAVFGNGRFVLGSEFIAKRGVSHIMSFLQTLETDSSSPDFSKYMNALVSLHNIGSYAVLSNQIYDDTPEEEIVETFLSINQSGVELNIGDLINAQSFKYQEIPNGLLEVFEKDITLALKNDKGMLGVLKKLGYRGSSFNIVPILNTLYHYDRMTNTGLTWHPNPCSEELFAFGAQRFFQLWSPPQKFHFFKALKWASDKGWYEMLTDNMLQWFAAFCMVEPKILEYPHLVKRLKYLLIYCTRLSLSNTQFKKAKVNDLMNLYCRIFEDAMKSPNPEQFVDFPVVKDPIQIAPDLILQTSLKKFLNSSMFLHLLSEDIPNPMTIDLNGIPLDPENREHTTLFPADLDIKGINSVANAVFCPIGYKDINNNLPFEKRMDNALKRLGKERFDEVCRVNMIPYDDYVQNRQMGMSEADATSVALYQRAVLMANGINEYLKNG